MPILLTGADLTVAELCAIARDDAQIAIAPAALQRMRAASEAMARVTAAGGSVYGVTTGLGSRVTEQVDGADEYAALRIVRGRATAVGEPLHREHVRAAMAVRLNGLCAGGSTARPQVAEGLAAMLDAEVHPIVPGTGSVGAADLCLMAFIGLALAGEGECELWGKRQPTVEALRGAGLRPTPLRGGDGLAVCVSSAVSAGATALALHDAEACLQAAQIAAALSMEGFRANLSPIDPRVVAARPAPGQAWAADGLRALLAGGTLTEPGAARRLQDPLSFRCVSPIHGTLRIALDQLAGALAPELNGRADNPLVLADDDVVLPTGNFQTAALTLALDGAAIAVAQVASAIAGRQARFMVPQLSGLERNLVPVGQDPASASGMVPLSKAAQALVLEIRMRAAPVAPIAAVSLADGVEDEATGAVQGALRLGEQLERLRRLVALELIVAAQAVDLAAPDRLGAGTAAAHEAVRTVVPFQEDDRPLGPQVERVCAALVAGGRLAEAVTGAVA